MSAAAALASRLRDATSGGRRTELGHWPVVIGLIIIAAGFQVMNDAFLSPRNLSNLTMQFATLAVLTLGVMMVLLIGEIDLSIGAVSGLAASAMALLSTVAGAPAWIAVLAAIAAGALIGLAQGAWVVVFKGPAFIVTLAGMLVWQGVQLAVLTPRNGQVRVSDGTITALATTYLPAWLSWTIAIAIMGGAGAWLITRRTLNARAGYTVEPVITDIMRFVLVVIVTLVVVTTLSRYLGIPLLLIIVLATTGVLAVVTGTTVFGRHIYAVGGNAEAARRTGIRVDKLRLAIFMTVSSLAALAGVLDAARAYSVSVNTGSGNTALNAIAAAVIGGTSLFGGRGSIIGALLGALVIGSVQNGLALIGQTAATQTIATGLILLAAVSLDMSTRKRARLRKARQR
jgi:D-xylose transport system permease protein